jgi:hypothetical protein
MTYSDNDKMISTIKNMLMDENQLSSVWLTWNSEFDY